MNKKLLFSITVLSSVAATNAFFDLDAFNTHFEKMEKRMRKAIKHDMKAIHVANNRIHALLKENADAVIVTIAGVTADNLEATINDVSDRLSITTPDNQIFITVRGNIIGIETAQEQKETHKKEEGDKDTFTAQYIGSSYSSMSQAVGANLLLDKRTIDYDEQKGELTVRIPKEEPKKEKAVTINKINTEKQVEKQKEETE